MLGAQCIECPDSYKADPANITLCDLYAELEMKTYENEQNEEFIMEDNIMNITCKYSNHSTSSDQLCAVWCQIEALEGRNCVDCPEDYLAKVNNNLICDLWKELNELQETQSLPLLPSVATVDCIYSDYADDSNLLCSLWCSIQEYQGSECLQCPDLYKDDPARMLLCQLWNQLEMLKSTSNAIIMPDNLRPVECQYKDHITSSVALCDLWCQIQNFNGKKTNHGNR